MHPAVRCSGKELKGEHSHESWGPPSLEVTWEGSKLHSSGEWRKTSWRRCLRSYLNTRGPNGGDAEF